MYLNETANTNDKHSDKCLIFIVHYPSVELNIKHDRLIVIMLSYTQRYCMLDFAGIRYINITQKKGNDLLSVHT